MNIPWVTPIASAWWAKLISSAGFTLAMIYHYVVPLNAVPFLIGIKGLDCGQMVWNLWWTVEAITHGRNPYYTKLLFYPLGSNLAHHTLVPGFFPITLLVKLVSGGDPLYPIYAYKIIILISFTLILFFTYLFLRELGFSRPIAATFAVAYAFSDFYLLHYIHLNHLAGFFIPLTALFLVRCYKEPRSRNLIAAAIAGSVAAYFTEFTIYIYMAVMMLLIMFIAFKDERLVLVEKLKLAGKRQLLLASIIFAVILGPFVLMLFTDKIRNPPLEEVSIYSANLIGFVVPGQERDQHVLHGQPYATPLYGKLFSRIDSQVTIGKGGYETFIGFPVLLCGLIAVIAVKDRIIRTCLVISLVFYVLSLGPTLKVMGTETNFTLPYALLMHVPPFDSGRTPIRFIAIGLFFLIIVAANGARFIESRLRNRTRAWLSLVAMLALLGWTIAEVYSPIKRREPFTVPPELSRIVAGPVLNLPPVQWDGYAALLQTQHHQPIDTGYVARNSDRQYTYFDELDRMFDKGGKEFCDYVLGLGFRNVLIKPGSVILPYSYSMLPLKLEQCAINVIDLRRPDSLPVEATIPIDFSDEGPEIYPTLEFGSRVEFGSAAADKYLWYGWSGREAFSHWTERGTAAFRFGVSNPRAATLVIKMGPFLVPPRLPSQRAAFVLNDQRVAELNLTNTEAEEFRIALPANVLRTRNVLIFELPDAEYPKNLGHSEDTRLLGINVQSIRIDPTP